EPARQIADDFEDRDDDGEENVPERDRHILDGVDRELHLRLHRLVAAVRLFRQSRVLLERGRRPFDGFTEQITSTSSTKQSVTDTNVLKRQVLEDAEHVAALIRDLAESFDECDDRPSSILLVCLLELAGGHPGDTSERLQPPTTRPHRLVDLNKHPGDGGTTSLRLNTHRRQSTSEPEDFGVGQSDLVAGT